MSTHQPPISLYLGDIDASVIQSVLKEKYASEPVSLKKKKRKKEGRGLLDFLALIFSKDLGINLLASIIYDLSKAAFSQLNLSFRTSPAIAIITFKDGVKIELPETLGKKKLKKRIAHYLKVGKVESIRYR